MDPERLRELLRLVEQARSEGRSDREISSALRRNRNVPVNSVNVLMQMGQAEGFVGPEGGLRLGDGGEGESENPLKKAAPFVDEALFGTAGEIIGGLENLGVARAGAAQRFREDKREATQENPITQIAARTVGLLGGAPGRAGIKAVDKAARAGASALTRAGSAAARRAGAGPLGQLAAGQVGRGVGATAAGGGASALEGGLLGFTMGESRDAEGVAPQVERRLSNATGFALPSAIVGGTAEGLLGGIRGIKEIRRLARGRGEDLANSARRLSQDLPSARGVDRRVDRAEEARRAAFREAEAAGKEIPGEVTDILAGLGEEGANPVIEQALRNAASQGSPEARKFVNALEEFRAGNRKSLPAVSFELADDIRKQMKFRGEAFERASGLLGGIGKPPSQGAVNEARRLNSLIEESLSEVPGFRRGFEESATAGVQQRARNLGRQIANERPDVAEDLLAGRTRQVGGDRVSIPNRPDARQALRAGLAEPMIANLRGGDRAAKRFLEDVQTSSDMRRRLRVILGSEDAVNDFVREAERLEALGKLDEIQGLLIRAAGFLGGGTSLFGTAAETLF